MEDPSDETYGRVTDAARFSVLAGAADDLVRRLELEFDVIRTEGLDVDPELAAMAERCLRVVRLTPTTTGAGPLTVSWTAFPGLMVRFGTWRVQAFPSCGCDHCDERPGELVSQLHGLVEVLVDGRLREAFDGERTAHSWADRLGFVVRGWVLLAPHRRGELGGTDTRTWTAWPRRTA